MKAGPQPESTNGLDPEQALTAFSDPEVVKQLEGLAEFRDKLVAGEQPCRHRLYWRLRAALEEEFLARLRSGELRATGWFLPRSERSAREVVNPGLWEVLDLDFEFSFASDEGQAIKIDRVLVDLCGSETFEEHEAAAPAGTDAGVVQPASGFVHSDDYKHIELGEHAYTFGDFAAGALRELYEARDTNLGWLSGKQILVKIGAGGLHLPDLFKNHTSPSWTLLIEGDGRGSYRLRRDHDR